MMELYLAPQAGIWIHSVPGWAAFRAALATGAEPGGRQAEPVSALLPVREGRRAPLQVRLALEAGGQVCLNNGVAAGEVFSVFASSQGDIQITDYLCRELAGPAPMLSPTRFHNSVHNAASGYWSIGTANRRASTAVAAQEFTFATALLEAASLAMSTSGIVMLVLSDVPAPRALEAVCRNRQPFAASILLSATRMAPDWRGIGLSCRASGSEWPRCGVTWLDALAAENDSGRCLPLLTALALDQALGLQWPLGTASSLVLEER